MWLEALIVVAATGVAAWLRPWRMLPGSRLWATLAAALLLLPWLWASQRALPGGLVVQLSGACLLTLMLGWPLAVLALWPIAMAGAALAGLGVEAGLLRFAWYGVVPATLALAIGALTRRWLPHHLFVYILGRGFFGTMVATLAAGALSLAWRGVPPGMDAGEVLVGHWLMAWGEATATGMLVAVFVAFRPEWLPTYSDRLYLPGPEAR